VGGNQRKKPICHAWVWLIVIYAEAIKRIETLWGAESGTPEGDELDALIELVRDYEQEFCPVPPPEEGDRS